MTCERTLDRLQDLLDGRLPDDEAAQVRSHVGGCADCARELAAYERLGALFRDVPAAPAPAGFRDGVMSRLPAGRVRAFPRSFGWIAALAAGVLLAVAVSHFEPAARTPETASAPESKARDGVAAEESAGDAAAANFAPTETPAGPASDQESDEEDRRAVADKVVVGRGDRKKAAEAAAEKTAEPPKARKSAEPRIGQSEERSEPAPEPESLDRDADRETPAVAEAGATPAENLAEEKVQLDDAQEEAELQESARTRLEVAGPAMIVVEFTDEASARAYAATLRERLGKQEGAKGRARPSADPPPAAGPSGQDVPPAERPDDARQGNAYAQVPGLLDVVRLPDAFGDERIADLNASGGRIVQDGSYAERLRLLDDIGGDDGPKDGWSADGERPEKSDTGELPTGGGGAPERRAKETPGAEAPTAGASAGDSGAAGKSREPAPGAEVGVGGGAGGAGGARSGSKDQPAPPAPTAPAPSGSRGQSLGPADSLARRAGIPSDGGTVIVIVVRPR